MFAFVHRGVWMSNKWKSLEVDREDKMRTNENDDLAEGDVWEMWDCKENSVGKDQSSQDNSDNRLYHCSSVFKEELWLFHCVFLWG